MSDPVRNEIVLPHLADLINRITPRTVCDVGCGTGYISRRLAQQAIFSGIHWLLVDVDPLALRFATSRPMATGTVQTKRLDLTIDRAFALNERADLAFAAFTLLEFEFTRSVARNLGSLVKRGGILSIFLPDPLDELIKLGDEDKMSAYATGSVTLEKVDKFTGAPYPFRLTRTDQVIDLLVEAGFRLYDLRASGLPPQSSAGKILTIDLIKERDLDADHPTALRQ